MSLPSILNTGLTGLLAAEQMASRASNNLANPATFLQPGTHSAPSSSTGGDPGQGSSTPVPSGPEEPARAEIGDCLVELILAQTQFRANVTVLEVVDELSAELAGIKRKR
jgi:flagellar hook protein FlgE